MAIDTFGFDGSIDEAQFSKLLALAGVSHAVEGPGHFETREIPGVRAVSIAPGTAYAPGVAAVSDAAITVNYDPPAAGAWYLNVLHRDWQLNSAEVQAIPYLTTSSVIPSEPPAGLPDLDRVPGYRDDQLLSWSWVNALNNSVATFDLRELTVSASLALIFAQLASLAGAPSVTWASLSGIPAEFTPAPHGHSAANITSGTLPISRGGTGGSTKTTARNGVGVYVQSSEPVGASSGDLWFW